MTVVAKPIKLTVLVYGWFIKILLEGVVFEDDGVQRMGQNVSLSIHPAYLRLSAEVISFVVSTIRIFRIAINVNWFRVKRSSRNLENQNERTIGVFVYNDILFLQQANADLLRIMRTIPKYLLVFIDCVLV